MRGMEAVYRTSPSQPQSLSQPGSQGVLARATRDAYCRSARFESRCGTTKFDRCTTDGQIIACSNPVSPTKKHRLALVAYGRDHLLNSVDHQLRLVLVDVMPALGGDDQASVGDELGEILL